MIKIVVGVMLGGALSALLPILAPAWGSTTMLVLITIACVGLVFWGASVRSR
jgi:hypothetical protein